MKIFKDLEQGTPEWLATRKGVVTGTKLKNVAGGSKAQLTEMYTLIAEEYIEEEEMNAGEILQRGHELEEVAKTKYEKLTGHIVEEVGFITKDDWHGLSPDGIILNKDTGLYTRALEIKCPRGKNYIKYISEDIIPSDYKQQVVNYFMVMEDLDTLDFMIFNPDVSEELPDYHIITVTREDMQKDIDKSQEKLDEFKTKWDKLKNKLKTLGK